MGLVLCTPHRVHLRTWQSCPRCGFQTMVIIPEHTELLVWQARGAWSGHTSRLDWTSRSGTIRDIWRALRGKRKEMPPETQASRQSQENVQSGNELGSCGSSLGKLPFGGVLKSEVTHPDKLSSWNKAMQRSSMWWNLSAGAPGDYGLEDSGIQQSFGRGLISCEGASGTIDTHPRSIAPWFFITIGRWQAITKL